ncbi:MAG: cobyrinate a,c-diamide synthase [Thermodesulfobacteriota bacterium]|nr:MAG: cobyrinate a,c-diamide synthase [Thermodesulfobacteriota bacterium]
MDLDTLARRSTPDSPLPGILIAGTHSGCGKTTVTLAIMAALKKRGLKVAPFKVGPDFIDPGHHASVCGCPSHNLDGWILNKSSVQKLYSQYCTGADVSVIEGVMGLFDGAGGTSESGSTAEIAKWLDLPILLIVDVIGMARSVAALVKGYLGFDSGIRFAGVVLNKTGSKRHAALLKEALSPMGLSWTGTLFRNQDMDLPSRHLGLITAEEGGLEAEQADLFSIWFEKGCDLNSLLKTIRQNKKDIRPADQTETKKDPGISPSRPVRIAVAKDEAFCFYYQANLDILEKFGAEIVFFSPLRDHSLPSGVQGLYLGGGYPELHAETLSRNRDLREEILTKAQENLPIYAECGGFLYLCRGLVQKEEPRQEYPWIGLFPFMVNIQKRRYALGYREIILKKDTILGPAGTKIRGHEFHYSNLVEPISQDKSILSVYEVRNAGNSLLAPEGYAWNNTLASYIHLHFGSCPDAAKNFVAEARWHFVRNRSGFAENPNR